MPEIWEEVPQAEDMGWILQLPPEVRPSNIKTVKGDIRRVADFFIAGYAVWAELLSGIQLSLA